MQDVVGSHGILPVAFVLLPLVGTPALLCGLANKNLQQQINMPCVNCMRLQHRAAYRLRSGSVRQCTEIVPMLAAAVPGDKYGQCHIPHVLYSNPLCSLPGYRFRPYHRGLQVLAKQCIVILCCCCSMKACKHDASHQVCVACLSCPGWV